MTEQKRAGREFLQDKFEQDVQVRANKVAAILNMYERDHNFGAMVEFRKVNGRIVADVTAIDLEEAKKNGERRKEKEKKAQSADGIPQSEKKNE